MMIEIDGKLVNPAYIVTAEIRTSHYVNGSRSVLVVKFADGTRFEKEHSYGFDAFVALDSLKAVREARVRWNEWDENTLYTPAALEPKR
jgi:hypothetical protein